MSRLSKGEKEFVAATADGGAEHVPPTDAGALPGDGMELLDARGISSPLHVLRAHRALRALPPGQALKVLTNAPQTLAEFQALVKYVVNYELVSQEQLGDEFVHVLRKKR